MTRQGFPMQGLNHIILYNLIFRYCTLLKKCVLVGDECGIVCPPGLRACNTSTDMICTKNEGCDGGM